MTVEVKSDDAQLAGAAAVAAVSEKEEPDKVVAVAVETTKVVVAVQEEADDKKKKTTAPEEPKEEGDKKVEEEACLGSAAVVVEKSPSFKEESNFLSDLKEHEKKALFELRAMVEEAILENKLFKKDGEKVVEKEKKEKKPEEAAEEEVKPEAKPDEASKVEVKPDEAAEAEAKPADEASKEEVKPDEAAKAEAKPDEAAKAEAKPDDATKEEAKPDEPTKKEVKADEPTKKEVNAEEAGKEEAKPETGSYPKPVEAVDGEIISLWGVPLLPSKCSESTDVILLKFLRAREFKVKDAFEMLEKTLRWRKESRIDSILEEDSLGEDLGAMAYMDGADREGHPICYNVYGVFQDDKLYDKVFGTEEKTEQFLRWRFQLMEKGIQKLDFKPGGVASILQITDLKNSPGVSKKELRVAMKRALGLLQDNYPEFVARNIFINVPFWYYAFNALLSPFLTQRTKSKFVFARPAKVTETLLKYIPAEDIPIRYGGLKRENDIEFSVQDGVSELIVKAGSTENIEIPTPEVGTALVWDLTVLGWEVNYKEEFVPTDEGSYTIIVKKGKKMGSQEEPVRNSFKNREPGKVVLTIENGTFWKKKVLFRYKAKSSS